jgi:lipoprotein-anchoring transpeptidase ErfK/SrfK
MWVDQIKTGDDGQVWYRTGEKYGTFGDFFWVAAESLRPVTAEEMAPLRPEVENKRVQVDLLHQTLSAYEGQSEVYFCQVSTGGKYDKDGNPSDKWATPVGEHTIWRKMVSVHMTGGTAGGGYDLAGIGWTVLFSTNGVALHSTFWHNNFGIPMSHGCVNLQPEDAKWLFRWTNPPVSYDPGDLFSKDSKVPATKVRVVEG